MNPLLPQRLALFPHTVEVLGEGAAAHLSIGGCNLADLAVRYGTPLYVFDAATLDSAAQSYADALHANYPADGGITYAGKAFLNRAVARWAYQRGLWVDCTGVGEIAFLATSFEPVVGTKGDLAVVEQCAKDALAKIDIGGDVHAPAEFRRHLAVTAAKRAVQAAYERAG